MILLELLLKNFEAHDFFRVKLDPYITSFIGETDSGKSSIIRAIEWITLNKPLGDDFIRDLSKPAYAGIRTEKGIVSRERGKGINIYRVPGLKKPLEGFGTSVPKEVQEFLNIGKLNFQFQFDAPYWFMISAPELSRQLNKIVDLEIIDTTLSNLVSKVRHKKAEVKVSKGRIKEAKTELKRLSFVKSMAKEYDQLSNLETEVKERQAHFNSLSLRTKDVKRYLLRAKTLSQAVSEGRKLIKIGKKHKNKVVRVETLSGIINNLKKDMAIAKAEIPNIKPLKIIYAKRKKARLRYNRLSKYIAEIISEQEKVCQKENKLIIKEKKLKKMIGKTCPLCKTKL